MADLFLRTPGLVGPGPKREHDEGELEQMRTLIHAQLLESQLSFAKAITKVELLRRQSGHVLPSAP